MSIRLILIFFFYQIHKLFIIFLTNVFARLFSYIFTISVVEDGEAESEDVEPAGDVEPVVDPLNSC